MNDPLVVRVDLSSRSYEVVIGVDVLDSPSSWQGIGAGDSLGLIVTNTTVAPLYAERLASALPSGHRPLCQQHPIEYGVRSHRPRVG